MKVFTRRRSVGRSAIDGFSLLEISVAVAIVGILMSYALASYKNYQDRVTDAGAEHDIAAMQLMIDAYFIDYRIYPDSLDDVGLGGKEDPWGNPYVYANHDNIPPGARRKDRNLVPINTDYDLYSKGEDGMSVSPLTAEPSRDDIVRGNNGRFVGPAEDY